MTLLRRLEIKNLALVKELDLEFEAGLNLITGETGAGKSILLDALGLALGFRGGSELLRSGEAMARVQALFELDPASSQSIAAWLDGKGLPSQGAELWLKRELVAQGRSRAWINGEGCPLAVLAELGERLVNFQGQHEHQSLLHPKFHMALLDESAGLGETQAKVAAAYAVAAAARARLRAGVLGESERLKRQELLSYQKGELAEASLVPGEREKLLEERRLSLSLDKRREALVSAHQAFFGSEQEGALQQLSQIDFQLDRLKGMDAAWTADQSRFRSSFLEIKDLADRVEREKDSVDFDPARAEKIEIRLHLLESLSKKYGRDEAGMLETLALVEQELEGLQDGSSSREGLEKAFAASRDSYLKLAGDLSLKRQAAGKALEKSVVKELADLGMPKAKFSIQWGAKKDVDGLGSAQGLEEAEFLLSANPGEAMRQLSKVASGGELSRITLALKTALAKSGDEATLVFDEVDSGISGRVAEVVGLRLAALARRCQLLCVTHLPQIASLPGRHLRVSKRVESGQTLTEAEVLDAGGREAEIAGMLSGREISGTALSHARELLSKSRS